MVYPPADRVCLYAEAVRERFEGGRLKTRPVTDRVKPSHRGSGQNQPVLFLVSYTFYLCYASIFLVIRSPDLGRM
jgi:hypothetical protein